MAHFHRQVVQGTSLLTSSFEEDTVIDDAFDALSDSVELFETCNDSNGMPFYFTQHKEVFYE